MRKIPDLSVYLFLSSYVTGLFLSETGPILFLILLPVYFVLRRFGKKGWCLCLFGLALGSLRMQVERPDRVEGHYTRYRSTGVWGLRFSGPTEERAKTYRAKMEVLAVVQNDTLIACTGKVVLYFPKDSSIQKACFPDKIWVKAELQPIKGFYADNGEYFDYAAYMARQGIYAQAFIRKGDYRFWEDSQERLAICDRCRVFVFGLRQRLGNFMSEHIGQGSELAVTKALILGERSSDPIEDVYRDTGIVHVLAVSGMHLSLFACMVVFSLSFMDSRSWLRWLRFLLLMVLVWGYAVLTGFSASVARAACMFTFLSIGKCAGIKTTTARSVSISALVLLVLDPHLVREAGFLLSYAAVLGLTFLYPRCRVLQKKKRRILGYVLETSFASIAAQAATLPIILHMFGSFPTYFLFANMGIAPVVNVVLPLGIAACLTSLFWDTAASFLLTAVQGLVWVMNRIALEIAHWPMAVLEVSLSLLSACILYIVLGIIVRTRKTRSVRLAMLGLCCLCTVIWLG